MKSVRFSQFLQVIKPEYKYYKVTPNNSVRNQSTYKIARAIASLYKNIFQRIRKEDARAIKFFKKEFLMGTKFSFNSFEKIGYFIYVEKKKVEFYFIIPKQHETFMQEQMRDSWSSITISEVEQIPQFDARATKYDLVYDKEDALSLASDRRNNELLRSNLNIINVLEEGDRVGIRYNFFPTNQHTWNSQYKATMEKIRNGEPVDKDKGKISYWLKLGINTITSIVQAILDAIVTKEHTGDGMEKFFDRLLKKDKEVSAATIDKSTAVVLNTQITVMSEAKEKVRQMSNARSLAQSFETISGDNRLVARAHKKTPQMIKVSDQECQNFISLAGREILEDYNFIEKVDTQETKVPEELQKGKIRIGINTHRGTKQQAYLSDDKEYKNLTLMLIGPTRAGKSTLIGNISKDALDNKECVIMFDYIKNCELSDEVATLFPKDKVLNIECNDFSRLQGLGYNEVGKEIEPFKQYDNAKKQTTQLMTLVNSINTDMALTAKMERYLTSASLVVFISNGSIKDVFDVLQDHNKRYEFLNKVPGDQRENLYEYMLSLRGLDEFDKDGGLVGTKLSLITGIIDRLNKLKANTYMELMLKKGIRNNIDLSEEIQKNQLICLKMPEDMFSTDAERDVYTTYWITKLWLALQMRAKKIKDRSKHTKLNLIIDEIYQVNNTERFLTDKLSRLAKFSVKPIISCHYINQLKYMRNELRSANASYMLISGCDKNNYNEFKEELYPYEMTDLLNLPRYHSLNIIKHQNGYGKFITKLPGPVGSTQEETQEKELQQV
jgi:hypothetical protein